MRTADGDDVGHVDLVARTVVAKAPDYEAELLECFTRWTGAAPVVAQAPETEQSMPWPPPAPPAVEPTRDAVDIEPPIADSCARDLAANVAGAAARAKRNEVNAQAPVLNFVARVLGVEHAGVPHFVTRIRALRGTAP